jgi:hypothetical protein
MKATCALILILLFSFVFGINAQGQQSNDQSLLKKTDLVYKERQQWRKVLKWPDSCEADFENREGTYAGMEFYELSPGKYVVEVECFLAAYQANIMYLYYDETTRPVTSKVLTFTVYDKVGNRIVAQRMTDLGGSGEFNEQTKELTFSTMFRGVGDCGSIARYGFRNGTTVLKEFRAKFKCDGKADDEKYYPVIFPKRKRRA